MPRATLALVLAVVTGCTTSSPPREDARTTTTPPAAPSANVVTPPGPAALAPGTPAAVAGATVTVTVRRSTSAVSRYGKPPARGQLVVARVSVQAAGSLAVNPFHFAARTPDGARYLYDAGNALGNSVDPVLHAVTLSAGERVSGHVVFDVPPGRGEIVYAPAGRVLATWRY